MLITKLINFIKTIFINIFEFLKFSIILLFYFIKVIFKIFKLNIYHGIKIIYHLQMIKFYKLYLLITSKDTVNFKKIKGREFLIKIQKYFRDTAKHKIWLEFSCYFYKISSEVYILTKIIHLYAWIVFISLLSFGLFKKFSLWYTLERYIKVQKFIIKLMFFVGFVGFTWSFHDDRFYYTNFIGIYMINWVIWQTGTYCFRVKFMSKWDYLRAFCFIFFWWKFHFIISFPILHWIVDRLDKTVDYESMGWVYKFEEYLESKGWMPEHQHTNKRKNELNKKHKAARDRAIGDFHARIFYQEEEKWTLLNWMRWQQERLMDQDDPDHQEWLKELNAKKRKKFLDDLKKRVKKGELTVEQIIEAKNKYEAEKERKKKIKDEFDQKIMKLVNQRGEERYGPRIWKAYSEYPEYKKKRLAEMRNQRRQK